MSPHISHQEYQLTIEDEIRKLARTYADTLKKQIDKRVGEMDSDDDSHFPIYQVLGVGNEEGRLIDVYQNKGPKNTHEFRQSVTPDFDRFA